MNVLVIGSGAREHALCWKLRQSKRVRGLFCAPGNPGTSGLAKNVQIPVDDIEGLVAFAQERQIDLTIVGPELPLSLGVVDAFQARGLKIFGPSRAAAQLESSKAFAKEIMGAAKVRTARAEIFTDRRATEAYVAAQPLPLVMKADGLASGKGVVVCHSKEEVAEGLRHLFAVIKTDRVIVEEFLHGREASFIVATDGTRVVPLAASHDYKRLLDANQGPNTGGMGSVSPTPVLDEGMQEKALQDVIAPVLSEMRKRGTKFQGFLYAGLMVSPAGKISVLEFNARLGDPETQVIMRRMKGDLCDLLAALADPSGSAPLPLITWSEEAAVCVVLASAGYPESPVAGDEITGLELVEMVPGAIVFHAGTEIAGKSQSSRANVRQGSGEVTGQVVTNGGRVLSVTAVGGSVSSAAAQAYKVCDIIQFKGRQLRRDIGR
ncbi:MAG: phosphoribosylamine--glycine ligase [Oligoflexia bacterium]|nr:phosphoribosylamine--glycine ligase [Oligoflexia bacterium]